MLLCRNPNKINERVHMTLDNKFEIIKQYLSTFPEKLSGRSKTIKAKFSQEGIESVETALKEKFVNGRQEKNLPQPSTIPDPAVSLVMNKFYNAPEERLESIKVEHQQSMLSENVVGDLLERYLATKLEPHGWVWCSGDFIKAIDFIKRKDNGWIELQVKNRDTTENSSSSAIRNGTEILKWYRSNSKKVIFNWRDFPDEDVCDSLSEDEFREFVSAYIERVQE